MSTILAERNNTIVTNMACWSMSGTATPTVRQLAEMHRKDAMKNTSAYNQKIDVLLRRAGYDIKDVEEVLAYIGEDRVFLTKLLQAPSIANRLFSSHPKLSLYVFIEEDSPDYTQLVVKIGAVQPPAEILAALRKFKDEWFLPLDYEIRRKLTIGIESLAKT